MAIRRKSNHLRQLGMLLIGVLVALIAMTTPAAAQDSGDEGPEGEAIAEIKGTLKVRNAEGESEFLEGVELVVRDSAGTEIGVATTDAEGSWKIDVLVAGTYTVELIEDTLPEGNSLRDPNKNPVSVQVAVGDSKNTLFAFGERKEADGGQVQAVQLFVDGIKLGLIIAMCAIGLSLIYGTTGLVNFAHGEMVTIGAMSAYLFHKVIGAGGFFGSLIFGGIMAVLIGAVAGGLFNETVWKPLRNRGASLIAALVVSIGFSILIRYIVVYFAGAGALFYDDYQIQDRHSVFGLFSIAPKDAIIIVASLAILIAVGLGLERTKAGKAMRAVADNRDLAESSGIDVETVIRGVWVVGSALAALGGVFFGVTESVGWEMGFRVLLLMFAGVTLGGLGTAYGALFGSVIIGVFIQMSTLDIGPWPGIPAELKNVGALIIMIIILLVRPQGLLGRRERIG